MTMDDTEGDLFTILPLFTTLRRTLRITSLHLRLLSGRTVVSLGPPLLVAWFSAWLLGGNRNATKTPESMTFSYYGKSDPFDEIIHDLPLVLWHAVVLGTGCMVGTCLVTRLTAEWYAQQGAFNAATLNGQDRAYRNKHPKIKYTSMMDAWRLTVRQNARILAHAALFMAVSVTAVWLVGHVLVVGLWDMRGNAKRAAHKDFVLAFIAMAATVMMLAVTGVAVFGVLWLLGMFTTVVPIVLLEKHDEAIDVFRQAYVLSRDSRSYVFASGSLVALPVALTSFIVSYPIYALTRKENTDEDFIEWLLLTTPGVLALYVPAFLGLPVSSVHQTVLYVTLRVWKDGLTLETLQGDLERSAPEYRALLSRRDEMGSGNGQDHNGGDVELQNFDHSDGPFQDETNEDEPLPTNE